MTPQEQERQVRYQLTALREMVFGLIAYIVLKERGEEPTEDNVMATAKRIMPHIDLGAIHPDTAGALTASALGFIERAKNES